MGSRGPEAGVGVHVAADGVGVAGAGPATTGGPALRHRVLGAGGEGLPGVVGQVDAVAVVRRVVGGGQRDGVVVARQAGLGGGERDRIGAAGLANDVGIG